MSDPRRLVDVEEDSDEGAAFKKAVVSSCGVKVQWPYPPKAPGTERCTSLAPSPLAATAWP